jgi:hypothetical protein
MRRVLGALFFCFNVLAWSDLAVVQVENLHLHFAGKPAKTPVA